jgi:FkbM family methyltransferase
MLLDFNYLVSKYSMKVNGVLHIGAHFGEEHHLYLTHGIMNIAYFEPIRSNFEVLNSRVTDGSLLYNIALGSEEREVEMYVETQNNGQSSSVLEPGLHLVQYPNIVFHKRETVQMRRLDDVIDNSSAKYNMINMDVQGYELEVLKGGVRTLANVDYIISEINRDEVYKGCARIEQLQEFLYPHGFVLMDHNWAGTTWGDGFFIKKHLIR